MSFTDFFLIYISSILTVSYYSYITIWDVIDEAKTSAEVLIIVLCPIIGIFIVRIKQRIEAIEENSHEQKN